MAGARREAVREFCCPTLIWSTELCIQIAAPAAAGLLASAIDPTAVLVVDAASYVASAALLARLHGALDTARVADFRPQGISRAIGTGLAFVWRQPIVRTLTLTGFGFNVACGGVFGLIVVYADQVLGLPSSDPRVGLIYAAAAAGAMIGATTLPAFGRRAGHGTVSIAGNTALAVAAIGLALMPVVAGALLLWAFWAFARITVNGNGITVRQLLTPDDLQGRVNTTGRMIAWSGTPFGAALGGLVAEHAGIRAAYLALALPAGIGVSVLLASPVRGMRIDGAR